MNLKFRSDENDSSEFYQTLKKRVDDYFEKNHLSRHGNIALYLKTAFFVLCQVGLYIAIMSDYFSAPTFLLLYMLFGIFGGLANFIAHDALHGAYSSAPLVNKIVGHIYDMNGTNSYIWKITHNLLHHTYTNIPGYDADIEKAPMLRLNPTDKLLPYHWYQNIYAFVLYCLTVTNWIYYADYNFFWKEWKKGKLKKWDICSFLAFKMANLILFIVLPLIFLHYSVWVILLGAFLAQMAPSIMASVIFQLAHVVQNVIFVSSDKGIVHHDWASHEMMTTSNFSTGNGIISHLVAGLNFQVEHHLFPAICHVHYPAIQSLVKKTAEEFRLPYNENATFLVALHSHYITLKKLGREPTYDNLQKN
jgi:linoleoyl-CoA desaturase